MNETLNKYQMIEVFNKTQEQLLNEFKEVDQEKHALVRVGILTTLNTLKTNFESEGNFKFE